ncbi:Plasma membrane sulfite pump involved in sulfite metabolism [Coemansia javaensis]|uniref:Plasma membrane sulfite pump involved in sulfite metabolism n=1 Tax=Coemansia javaensis TaxID=2761396 RepID=A0A9W8HF34_9FUNG|nr:Plasma membrane sulfite pump involved in sulfite metabolism [Coemansia javaensis]
MHSRTTTTHSEVTLAPGAGGARRHPHLDAIKTHIQHPMAHLDRRRDAIRGFSPAWFTASMGTGMVCVVLEGFPYAWPPLRYAAMVFGALNLLMFVVFAVLLAWRLVQYRDLYDILLHPQLSMSLGAIPMALSTLTTNATRILAPYDLRWLPTLALVLWIVGAALSVLSLFSIPFLATTHHKHLFEKINATILMPVVTTVVSATTGAHVASVHASGSLAGGIVVASYALLGAGLITALMLMALYLVRLTLFGLPPRETVVSTFLPVGPLGQSSCALQLLGTQARRIFPDALPHVPPSLGETLYSAGFLAGLLIWAAAIWWLAYAVYVVVYTRVHGPVPFNLGWWALIFPSGTVETSTNVLWAISGIAFFRVLAAILSASIVVLWAVVAANTICYAWTGELLKPVAIRRLELVDDPASSAPASPASPEQQV